MLSKLFCPGLLDTGAVSDRLMVVRDGVVNFYILKAPTGLICIDTGWRSTCVSRGFEVLGLDIHDVVAVLVTHLHWDHAGCVRSFPDADVYVGAREDPALLAKRVDTKQHVNRVKDEQTLMVAGLAVRAIATTGHTAGSVSYVVDETLLFSGDTLRLKCGKVHPFLSNSHYGLANRIKHLCSLRREGTPPPFSCFMGHRWRRGALTPQRTSAEMRHNENCRPFPAWLNRDGEALNQSIRRLADIKGIECLLTAHSGISRDIENAFSQWRGEGDRS